MRLTGFLLLAAALASGAGSDDLQAIQAAFRQRDASLDWFHLVDEKPLDPANSVMLVEAAPTELRPGAPVRSPVYAKEQIGLFVVSEKHDKVRLVLDSFPLSSVIARPKLELTGRDRAYLHFYSDYGFYRGSIKYVFDPRKKRPPKKYRYGALALKSVTRQGGDLLYQASFPASRSEAGDLPEGWQPRYSVLTIHPRGDSQPSYKIAETAAHDDGLEPDPTWLQVGAEKVLVVHGYQANRGAGVQVRRGREPQRFRLLPVPTVKQYTQLRPGAQKPVELENDIGPYATDGAKLWFADTFYDGEGISGLGAIGSFDPVTFGFEWRYLPQITPWSGSALLIDGRDLWVGLMRRPEGANYGAGLLRYNMDTGDVTVYPVTDLIYTLDRIGATLYCGTSHGLYTVHGDQVTQFRFEPDAHGKLSMLAREVR